MWRSKRNEANCWAHETHLQSHHETYNEREQSTWSSLSLSRILIKPIWSFPPKWSASLIQEIKDNVTLIKTSDQEKRVGVIEEIQGKNQSSLQEDTWSMDASGYRWSLQNSTFCLTKVWKRKTAMSRSLIEETQDVTLVKIHQKSMTSMQITDNYVCYELKGLLNNDCPAFYRSLQCKIH